MISRSVLIRLRRKLPSEKIQPVSAFDGTNLRRKLARWVMDNGASLAESRPRFPRGITDRLADAWKPLLSIADLAIRKWPKLARETAVALSARHAPPSVPELLLADIKEVFGTDEALSSSELVKRLLTKSDAPWAGDGLNEWVLAQKLESFGIFPRKMRLGPENKRVIGRKCSLKFGSAGRWHSKDHRLTGTTGTGQGQYQLFRLQAAISTSGHHADTGLTNRRRVANDDQPPSLPERPELSCRR